MLGSYPMSKFVPHLETNKYDRYKASSFRAFNERWPDRYDSNWWLHVFCVDDWDRSIIAEMRPTERMLPILDVGCANGRLLAKLARSGAQHLCGVDLAPRMLEKTDEKLKSLGVHYELKVADVEEKLPFADGFFGVVVLSAAIHHFFRPGDALTEIERVLCPCGRLFVVEPRFPPVARQLLNSYLRWFSHDGDCRFYSPKGLTTLIGECGFGSSRVAAYPGRFSYMIVANKSDQTEQDAQPVAAVPNAVPRRGS